MFVQISSSLAYAGQHEDTLIFRDLATHDIAPQCTATHDIAPQHVATTLAPVAPTLKLPVRETKGTAATGGGDGGGDGGGGVG